MNQLVPKKRLWTRTGGQDHWLPRAEVVEQPEVARVPVRKTGRHTLTGARAVLRSWWPWSWVSHSTSPSTSRWDLRTKLVASLYCEEVRTSFSVARPLWWMTVLSEGIWQMLRVGRHCGVKSQSVLRPPFKKFSKGCIFSFTYWGPHLYWGRLCGQRSSYWLLCSHWQELCDWVLVCLERLLKNSWQHSITPRNCGPPFTVFSGCPGLFSGELPECTQELMTDITKSDYQQFFPLTQV